MRKGKELRYFRLLPKNIAKDIWYYENPRSITVIVYVDNKHVHFNMSKCRLKKILNRMD